MRSKQINFIFQEDLQMTVKGGKHQLTGMVSLGGVYNSMKKIESRKPILYCMFYKLLIELNVYSFLDHI
jgi:hypothetical protein